MKRRPRSAGCCLPFVVGLLLGAMSAVTQPATAAPPVASARAASTPVATVDGKPIPAAVFRYFLTADATALGLDPGYGLPTAEQSVLERTVLDALVRRALVVAAAERRGLPLGDTEIAAREEDLAATLVARDAGSVPPLDPDALRWIARAELAGERLRAAVAATVRIDEATVRRAYDQHRDDPAWAPLLRAPEQVHAAHVLVAAREPEIRARLAAERGLRGRALYDAVAREVERRRARAEEVRRRAASGDDFAGLARRFSDDAATRSRGGDLGTFPRSTHTPAFDRAVFALPAGTISPVLRTEFGFHVVRVTEHLPARLLPLAEVAPTIRSRLRAAAEAHTLGDWIAAARAQATVRVDRAALAGVRAALSPTPAIVPASAATATSPGRS